MTSNFEYKVYIYNYYNYLNNSIYTVYIIVITEYSIAIYLVVRYGSAFWSRSGDYLVLLLNSTALAGVTFKYCYKGRTKDKLNSFFITIQSPWHSHLCNCEHPLEGSGNIQLCRWYFCLAENLKLYITYNSITVLLYITVYID